jgi:reactive intermediate/imine deaminase
MVAISPETGEIVGDTVGDQTEQVLKNIKAILEEAGCKMDDVVKTTVHLADMELFGEFNDVYSKFFPDPKPARTTVGSQLNKVLVEIDVVAYREG